MKLSRMGLSTGVGLALLCIVAAPLFGQDVSTGPSLLSKSGTTSSYLRGAASMDAKPTAFRIIGVRRTQAGVSLEGVLLDAYGNTCPSSIAGGSWEVTSGCRGDALLTTHEALITGRSWQSTTPPMAMHVLIDHSLTSQELGPDVLRGIRDVLPGLVGEDSVGVAVFNHQITEITPITAPYIVAQRIGATAIGASSGLPGVTDAMMQGLRILEARTDESKALVVVTSSNDMTNLGTSTTDLIAKARSAGVTIYIVKVGHSAHGYQYRYVSASTGGRLYMLEHQDAEDVVHILREILYGSKQHVELFVAQRFDSIGCDDLLFRAGWRTTDGSALYADTMLVPIKERSYSNKKAVVAAFPDTSDVGLREYYSILSLLAEDLMADSGKVIQLVGHVSPDIKSDHDERALERVGFVSAYLKSNGVRDVQIRTRSAGSQQPLYYLQQDGSQRLMNNRVEAYYLYAADLPYTITVGQFATEEQAEASVDTWNERGFKAYFEPIVVDRSPAYSVKLWGYRTENEALVDARSARSKYNAPVAIVE